MANFYFCNAYHISSRSIRYQPIYSSETLAWATALRSNDGEIQAYDHLIMVIWSVYNHLPKGKGAGECLLILNSGAKTAVECVPGFTRLAVSSGWKVRALTDSFYQICS